MNTLIYKILKHLLKPLKDYLVSEHFPASIAKSASNPSLYTDIFKTPPYGIKEKSDLELHMLVGEKDFLRSFWSLKSFYYYSGLPARLVIQDDGSLSSDSINRYYEHFPGCIVNTNNDEPIYTGLKNHPMCQFFYEYHVIAKKLFPPLLVTQANYVVIMDSDILWFKRSRAITDCIRSGIPFCLNSGSKAYVRNQEFMENKLELYPANNVNSGIIGYRKSDFLDLNFIEAAIGKLVHVSKDLIRESAGYLDSSVNIEAEDINQTVCWWVMEQTIYALLLGRNPHHHSLKACSTRISDQLFGSLHQFTKSPIMKGTALIHFISDQRHNQFFPVGVEHLIKRGFLNKYAYE
uniref:Nucleotide-diphospho-sugar transferase domain-containing protein n=1 Tax=Cyanothece sp. (strain PCC 7425 / ATCC 29141) TaxID=395961 RepID=B8HPW9_CYAP4